ANLTEANLNGANLSGANLRYVDLTEANLDGANISYLPVPQDVDLEEEKTASEGIIGRIIEWTRFCAYIGFIIGIITAFFGTSDTMGAFATQVFTVTITCAILGAIGGTSFAIFGTILAIIEAIPDATVIGTITKYAIIACILVSLLFVGYALIKFVFFAYDPIQIAIKPFVSTIIEAIDGVIPDIDLQFW
ncbi:MAG TPA: pentapeptide repeat-containing protein, partial [Methanocorpusculum sp.]|nr:pentapeptide repeat-containing protein [Methanocorpusculum sp.]